MLVPLIARPSLKMRTISLRSAQDETWIKNQDTNGNTYYFNQLTNETKWMPPCGICQKEMGKRICETCGFVVYCYTCYEAHHEKMENEGKDHIWKAADIDKEELKRGEKYCIKCCVSAAKRACKVSERSERACILARDLAKWLQTATSTTKLTYYYSTQFVFVWLACFARASLKMRLASLGAGLQGRVLREVLQGRARRGVAEQGERAKRTSLDEDDHTRDESREMANRHNIMDGIIKLILN